MDDQGSWQVEWYWPDDTMLLRIEGYLSIKMSDEFLRYMQQLQDEAKGDLKLYVIADESKVTGFDDTISIQITLHPAAFHPRGGKVYFVGSPRELRLSHESLNLRRPDTARFVDSIEEAAAEIQKSRAAYRARQQAQKDAPQ